MKINNYTQDCKRFSVLRKLLESNKYKKLFCTKACIYIIKVLSKMRSEIIFKSVETSHNEASGVATPGHTRARARVRPVVL